MAKRQSNAGLWIALGVGAVVVGAGIYFLTSSSSQSSTSGGSQQLPPVSVTEFEPGKAYTFTTPLPAGTPENPNVIRIALQAAGWTNVSVSAVDPNTYTATATWSGSAPASMPPGTTAALA